MFQDDFEETPPHVKKMAIAFAIIDFVIGLGIALYLGID